MPDLTEVLDQFVKKHRFEGKGPLCVALVVTQHARKIGLPLDPSRLVTKGGGQVLGLGRSAVQAVLKRHGIVRLLAAEGGRTSRGSLKNMERYVILLNDLNAVGRVDLGWIERYWIACVQQFFAAKLFTLKIDHARSLRSIVSDILRQALNRQREMTGVPYAGAVLQHLVGAKLELMLESEKVTHKAFVRRIRHHSVSTADLQSGRSGDFVIGTSSIHVTTAPSEALIDRCQDNLNSGVRPIIVTMKRQVRVAEGLSENRGIASRIDIFEIEQFIAANLYEIGGFDAIRRDIAIQELVNRYNTIVDNVETDPSIRIALRPVRMR